MGTSNAGPQEPCGLQRSSEGFPDTRQSQRLCSNRAEEQTKGHRSNQLTKRKLRINVAYKVMQLLAALDSPFGNHGRKQDSKS